MLPDVQTIEEATEHLRGMSSEEIKRWMKFGAGSQAALGDAVNLTRQEMTKISGAHPGGTYHKVYVALAEKLWPHLSEKSQQAA